MLLRSTPRSVLKATELRYAQVLVAVALVALALLAGIASGSGRAAAGEAQIQVTCSRVTDGGVAICRATSDTAINVGDPAIEVEVTLPDGRTQTVTLERDDATFRQIQHQSCAAGDYCYVFSFEVQPSATPDDTSQPPGTIAAADDPPSSQTEQPQGEGGGTLQPADGGAEQTAQHPHLDTGTPCPAQPYITCIDKPDTGSNTVVVVVDDSDSGTTVAINDEGQTGQSQVDHSNDWQANVDDAVDDDDLVVIYAATGGDSSEETHAKIDLEQQLYDRGKPYQVCFEAVTYVDGFGETVTRPEYCVIVTPK